jgi:hypothetical protein
MNILYTLLIWMAAAAFFTLLWMRGGKRVGTPKTEWEVLDEYMTEQQRIDAITESVAHIEKRGYITAQYLYFKNKEHRYLCDCSSDDLGKATGFRIDYFVTKTDES